MATPPPEVRADAWQRVQQLYATPNDIDLFTGGLIENAVPGGLSGPTFNCIKVNSIFAKNTKPTANDIDCVNQLFIFIYREFNSTV